MGQILRKGESRIRQIAHLNDLFRHQLSERCIFMTRYVHELPDSHKRALFSKLRNYRNFSHETPVYLEHDFGIIEHEGERYYWKIHYYDGDFLRVSSDPSDDDATIRTLTLMRSDEYLFLCAPTHID